MNLKFITILLYVYFANADDTQKVPVVEISNGLLQGVYEKSYNGRTFSSFEGIPYARPPVGELRFEPPKEPYNWTGTWIANTKHTCIQTGLYITGDEDCLYVNVYVPREKPSSNDNFNVVVHIHGGGFSTWSAHTYSGPKYLMDEDVIFVTMNYRLGPFGFLSTHDEVVPGNNGLKDQAFSLQWIQKNIKYFGGNPNSVTITGMSAGAGAVHLHYFSRQSKGLFHQGVSNSGNAIDPWAIRPSTFQATKHLAENLGCPTKTSRELVDCMKSRSATKISESMAVLLADALASVTFAPVVEHEHDGAFLTQYPYKMLLDGTVTDVPWVVSVADREGIFLLAHMAELEPNYVEKVDNLLPEYIFYTDVDVENQKIITNKIKEHYFKDNSREVDEILIDIFSDRVFLLGADTAAKLQAKVNKSPVYFYKFDYHGQHNLLELVTPNKRYTAATHGDDCLYYLHCPVAEEKLSESDEKMKSKFLQWLTNFASTQKPKIDGIQWNPVSGKNSLEYLNFKDPDNLFMETVEGMGAGDFWSKLPTRQNELQKRIKTNCRIICPILLILH